MNTRINMYVPAEKLARWRSEAERTNRSLPNLMEKAMDEYLSQAEKGGEVVESWLAAHAEEYLDKAAAAKMKRQAKTIQQMEAEQ